MLNKLTALTAGARNAVSAITTRSAGATTPATQAPSPSQADALEKAAARSRPLDRAPPDVTTAQRRAATTALFERLGLDATAQIDPARIDALLTHTLALGPAQPGAGGSRNTQRAQAIRARLEEAIRAQGSLGELAAGVQRDLVEKHTPISDFLALADLEALTASPAMREVALGVAHHVYVLDALVKQMIADPELSKEVRRHFYHQRAARGISLSRIAELAGTFGAVKAATIDMVFRPILGITVGLERTREASQLGLLDRLAWGKSGVPLNITEAMVTEAFGQAYDNALAAFRLAVRTPKESRLGGENRELLMKYPQGWTELYQSWNLLFVLSNLEDPQLLVPKLLVPSLTSADSESYIYRRTLALWITIQTYLFTKHEGTPGPELELDPARVAEAKQLWGRINRKYSERLGSAEPEAAPRKTRSLI